VGRAADAVFGGTHIVLTFTSCFSCAVALYAEARGSVSRFASSVVGAPTIPPGVSRNEGQGGTPITNRDRHTDLHLPSGPSIYKAHKHHFAVKPIDPPASDLTKKEIASLGRS